jgi:hypothetical protein
VTDLAFAALSHPQTAFTGLQKSLQHKWQFIQRVIDDISDCFSDIKEAIANIFLPALYSLHHNLAALLVKFAGLAIPDPSATSERSYEASTLVCSQLLSAFRGADSFSSTDHKSIGTVVMAEVKSCRAEKLDSTLTSFLSGLDCDTHRTTL